MIEIKHQSFKIKAVNVCVSVCVCFVERTTLISRPTCCADMDKIN